MAIRELVPWSWGNRKGHNVSPQNQTLASLHDEVNKIFDGFMRGFWDEGSAPFERGASFAPKVDIAETDETVEVVAELPGLSENDVALQLSDSGDVLTIQGTKSAESEDKKKDYYRVERSYGTFFRSVPLPAAVDPEKAAATFKKGELHVTMPKLGETHQSRKRIPVSAG
jgi:HSP20 family protein